MTTDELAAHVQIRQVLYRYCRGVDRGDAALLKSVYHPEAIDIHGSWEGPGEEFAERIVRSLDEPHGASQHHLTNVLIELDGDRAAVESYFIAFHPYDPADGDTEKIAFVGGRYLDRFERRDDDWRIVHRQVVLDWSRADLGGEVWAAQQAFPRGRRRDADPSAGLFA